jgi:aerobic C4-dicarboxylate transport protein
MSEARAITNLIGNGVGAIVVSRWEKELDTVRARRILANAEVADEYEAPAGYLDRTGAAVKTASRGFA